MRTRTRFSSKYRSQKTRSNYDFASCDDRHLDCQNSKYFLRSVKTSESGYNTHTDSYPPNWNVQNADLYPSGMPQDPNPNRTTFSSDTNLNVPI